MLTLPITYENFDGNEVTEKLYFGFKEAELVEWEMETNEGIQEYFTRVSQSNDRPQLMAAFKKLITATYGEKSDDGRHFRKTEQIRQDFVDSAAYNAVFLKFFSEEDFPIKFLRGVMPQSMLKDADIETVMKTPDQRLQAVTDSLMPPPPPPTFPANPAGA